MQKVSIVLPCKNAAITIKACLDSIARLNYPKQDYELIVVEGDSVDGTKEIVEKFREANNHLDVIFLQEAGKMGAGYGINLGLNIAKYEFVAFTNADCTVDRNWLETILEPFKDDKIAGVAGMVVTPENVNLLQKLIGYELEYRYSTLERYLMSAPEMNLAYRKTVLEEIGRCDWQNLKTGYDVDVAYRVNKAGYKIIFHPKAKVSHYHRGSLKEYWKQQVQAAESRIKIIWKHKSIRGDNFANRILMTQPFLLTSVVASLLLSTSLPITQILFYITVGIYLGLNFIYTMRIFNRFPFLHTLILFPLNIFRGIALTVGVFKGMKNLIEKWR